MKLSIIIPTYNVEDYIEECLISLLPQIQLDTEVIIVDDGSTDHTVQVIQEILVSYPGSAVRLYPRTTNEGVSRCRNFGIKAAQGQYITFIDGDDYVQANYIESIYAALCDAMDYYKLSWTSVGTLQEQCFARTLPKHNCSVWSRVFKKEILKVPFDIHLSYGEDAKFLKDNIKLEHTVGYIEPYIYVYRRGRAGSLSTEATK